MFVCSELIEETGRSQDDFWHVGFCMARTSSSFGKNSHLTEL